MLRGDSQVLLCAEKQCWQQWGLKVWLTMS